MKLCSDCRHFRPFTHTQEDGSCTFPDAVWIHPVSGTKRFPLAFSQRMSVVSTACGLSAQHWDYNPGSPPEPDTHNDVAF
jgi:hypothetical protein